MLHGVYEKTIDRESAAEMLAQRAKETMTETQKTAATSSGGFSSILLGSTGPRGGRREGLVEAMAKSAVRTIGSSVGREIIRGVLGSMFGGGARRR